MAVAYRKPGNSITCPAGQVLVIVSVPIASLPTSAPVGADLLAYKKLAAIDDAQKQLSEARLIESKTDAALDTDASDYSARIAALKAARPSGAFE